MRPLRGRLDPAGGPWRLQRLWVQREPGVITAVSVALTFDSVRAGQGGAWRLVEGFDDPARWYSLNDNAYEPGDTLGATTGVDGAALRVAIDAPDSGSPSASATPRCPRPCPPWSPRRSWGGVGQGGAGWCGCAARSRATCCSR